MGTVVMVQGTTSGAGKSLLVAALCRIYARRGFRAAPFKCQNMSLNSFATPAGGEIGRSQALQAQAARIDPHVDMNPILLKPAGRKGCQVVVLGRPTGHCQTIEYERLHGGLFPLAMAALNRLRSAYEVVIAEGAGSPAEINLREKDIANMAVARYAGAPVLLVGDIDRGGVFASLLGTVELLTPEDRGLVAGFVINQMRGDAAVLDPGLAELTSRTGIPVLGVIPHIADLALEAEDSLDLGVSGSAPLPGDLRIAVVRLPHISNFTDFQMLEMQPGVAVRYADAPLGLAGAHAVILPGTKETIADLKWLRARRLSEAVIARHEAGHAVLGVCGGLQMLGRSLKDPSTDEEAAGLGLLPVDTVFHQEKRTVQAQGESLAGYLDVPAGLPLVGYEIHMGHTSRFGGRPFARISAADGRQYEEGAIADDGRVAGTYLHGLFDSDAYRHAWLEALGRHAGLATGGARLSVEAVREAGLERLADTVEGHLDIQAVDRLLRIGASSATGKKG